MAPRPAIRAFQLTKTYPGVAGGHHVTLFQNLDLVVQQEEMVAVVGESGSGKSTLLQLLAALDTPTSGEVWCGETHLGGLTREQAANFRNSRVGYVWQFHYLLPEFTAQENVAMPLLARGNARSCAMRLAADWLDRVGLQDRLRNRSGELSGGEQQRVSLARALVTGPDMLLADEPTGNLDRETASAVLHLIRQLHREQGLTSILVTHDPQTASRCDRLLRLRAGRLEAASTWLGSATSNVE